MGIVILLQSLHRLRHCAAILALAVPLAVWSQPRFDRDSTQTVLPASVVPQHVRLDLDVDPARLGWQPAAGEDGETQTLRADLIHVLAAADDMPTLAAARQRFAQALAPGAGDLPAALRGPVLAAVGQQASEAEFDALRAALRRSESEEERRLLMDALASGQDLLRAERVLDEALAGRLPPNQSAALPGMLGDNPALVSLAYRFVLAHWDALARPAGDGPFGGRHWPLPGAAGSSSEPALAQQLLLDQQRLAGASGASSAQRMAASVEARHRLREREAGPLAAALVGWAPRASAAPR